MRSVLPVLFMFLEGEKQEGRKMGHLIHHSPPTLSETYGIFATKVSAEKGVAARIYFFFYDANHNDHAVFRRNKANARV